MIIVHAYPAVGVSSVIDGIHARNEYSATGTPPVYSTYKYIHEVFFTSQVTTHYAR